ncbi:capsule biosynthesis GfcC D2 domain-containing protein [Pseudidiomarina insulisalsae]|uniref:Uncharacterized protein n=1 Tax=Pseudidiomarina insulisalsae TaxID=575789 RepID=A0A432YNS1_9GAMM|nr:capsule biosynthesis GfcC D2 domain-containing protein [Pseudidiomarina insulisalsae]RUO62593.1 hypothetical protein CWI71_03950 [Pseudidiomarina insulisalsae]
MKNLGFRTGVASFIVAAMLTTSTTLAAPQQAQADAPATQVIVGEGVVTFSKPARLLNLYQIAQLDPSAYWPSSRLISSTQTNKLQQRRQFMLEQLSDLAQSAFIQGEEELAAAARAYAAQIPGWPLIGAEWVGVTKIDDRLDVQSGVDVERPSLYSSFNGAVANLQANPQLPEGQLQFLPPADLGPWQVTVISPAGVQQFNFDETDTVRGILQRAGSFSENYDLAEVTLVSLTGLSRTTHVAYYNDDEALPPVHGIIFVGLDVSNMNAGWQQVNAQLAALLSYWNPQS